MTTPAYHEAGILLQFLRLGAEMDVQSTIDWIWGDEFETDFHTFQHRYPPGSSEFFRTKEAIGWFEILGTFFKHNLIGGELLFDLFLIRSTWERSKGFALGLREQAAAPRLYENFEAMAEKQPI